MNECVQTLGIYRRLEEQYRERLAAVKQLNGEKRFKEVYKPVNDDPSNL